MKKSLPNSSIPGKKFSVRFAALSVLLILSGLSPLNVRGQQEAPATTTGAADNPSAAQTPQQGKSIVRGHVVYENNGRPVRRARVFLLNSEGDRNNGGPERTAMTNGRGEFQIKNVPAGKYFVMVDAAGIVTPISLVDFDQLRQDRFDFEEIKKQFEEIAVDGINNKEVEVRARRGGAISGRITYEDGDPAVNVRVNIMRSRNGQPARFLTNISPSALFGMQTDDRGMYRIAGLPPGEYTVSASENIEHGSLNNYRGDAFMMGAFGENSLVSTYYQNATSVRQATLIKIDAGEEEKNIDITIAERALHNIAGTVRSKGDGRPLRNARLSIENKDDAVPQFAPELQTVTTTDETGQFTINELPDGVYTITVQPSYEDMSTPTTTTTTTMTETYERPQPVAPQLRKKFFPKQQEVKVAGRDVPNVIIEMPEGGRISGTVLAEEGQPLPSGLIVFAEKVGEDVGQATQSGVDQKGQFVIDGVPTGKMYLNVYFGPEARSYAKSITYNGTDLMREPLIVQEDAEIGEVRILISSDVATLSGHVLSSESDKPLSGAYVLLVPADPKQWQRRSNTRYSQPTDSEGSFTVNAGPGEYLVLLVRAGDFVRAFNEEFIRARSTTATRITLRPDEQKSLELRAPRSN
ncbi:MAG TPA: carboxypeptidase-like regulatory domain-containing protein [Pyrinomonadaceae bacterium]